MTSLSDLKAKVTNTLSTAAVNVKADFTEEVNKFEAAITAPVKTLFHKFTNTYRDCKYIFTNGKVANFLSGEYITDNKDDIAELLKEVNDGHPNIGYVGQVDVAADPLAEIKARAIAEYLDAQKTATDKTSDKGTTSQGALSGVANSNTVAEGSAASTSAA